MERNPHITLAHVNPEAFPPLDSEPDKHCSMWFIGLLFAKSENLNIDLTYDIKSFVETSKFDYKLYNCVECNKYRIMQLVYIFAVERQAEQINMLKEGMWIEAKHVKRRDLHTYVSPSLLKKERKVVLYLDFIY